MNKKATFSQDYESLIPSLVQKGVREFSIHDSKISTNKKRILNILNLFLKYAPEVFLSILVDASIIDNEVVGVASQIYCSFEIPLECKEKGGKLLFDKKYYSKKANLLNCNDMIFGFTLTYGRGANDCLKDYLDRLDFAVQQYPNHLIFPQLESEMGDENTAKVTGTFSAKDIRYARDISFSAKTFYSEGRAVPWFLSVLRPLRIYPSRFFADFAEWQRCNNCDFKSGFTPENEKHKDIERMQLLFVDEKYEEKQKKDLTILVNDIISINGAMSRLVGEDEESIVETSYHPDELFGEESMDLEGFVDNVCMEHCSVEIFAGDEGPDYQVL